MMRTKRNRMEFRGLAWWIAVSLMSCGGHLRPTHLMICWDASILLIVHDNTVRRVFHNWTVIFVIQ
jgi:hypothetical protein